MSPNHRKEVSNFYLEWANNINPWILLDESSWPDHIIRATHYIFGSVVVSAPKTLITAWIYEVATGRLIHSEQIEGRLSTSDELSKLAEQLGVRITK